MLDEQPYSGWQEFARQNNLTFKPSNFWLMRKAHVTGNYCGYGLRLETFSRSKEAMMTARFPSLRARSYSVSYYTRMILWVNNPATTISSHWEKLVASGKFDMEKMVDLLIPASTQHVVKGQFYAYGNGREVIYERENLVSDAKYLQLVLDGLKELVEVYPRVVELGGQAVSGLLPISKRYHPLQQVAAQLLFDIAKDTEKRLKRRAPDLLCPYCLIHCSAHQITTPWIGSITYYGCKICNQSREFIGGGNYRLIALLDRASMTERSQDNATIRVNWIIYRKLFDFDEVEIVRATDEDVEYFAVQMGNDTDPIRSRCYKQMRCTVSLDCRLSENTIRILQRTFGQVEIKAG